MNECNSESARIVRRGIETETEGIETGREVDQEREVRRREVEARRGNEKGTGTGTEKGRGAEAGGIFLILSFL